MAISLKNKNFAKSTLAEDLASDELILDIATGTGTLFPAAGSFRCVIWSSSYGSPISDTNREFVTATLSGTDELTLTRAQESTIARAWSNGDNIALVITAGKVDELETEINAKTTLTSVINTIYPVGSIYISTLSTNPGTLLGVGTWAAFGAGRTLVGLDAGQTEFDTVEETGGAKTHVLSIAELAAHSHTPVGGGFFRSVTPGAGAIPITEANGDWNDGVNATTASSGSGTAHNNLQPYIVVYMWKRIA